MPLAEHVHASDVRLVTGVQTCALPIFTYFDNASFDAASHNGSAAGNREHVFDRHQERPVDRTIRLRNIAIHGIHQSLNRISADVIITTFQSSQSRTLYDGNIVAGEIVAGEQFTNFQLNEFQQFLVVDLIDLVHIDHKGRNTDLTCEQDVFTSLRHGTVSGVNHKNSAIHLSRAGDHVLQIVSVNRAVDVRIVTSSGFVFDMRGLNKNTALALFRSEEHTSELQSLMRISYAVFFLQ